jgi:protease-4
MGGVAASGGYYIAAGADRIWAEPTTITGSIGVFSGKFAVEELYERVGIGTHFVARGRNAGMERSSAPWDDIQRERMQALVNHTYEDFKSKVAHGRSLTPEQTEAVARGRVWSGRAAAEVGLVDGLGSLHDAIRDARELAKIPESRDVALVSYNDRGDLIETIAPTSMTRLARVGETLWPRWAGALAPVAPLTTTRWLPEALTPALLIASEPDGLWMFEPTALALDPR